MVYKTKNMELRRSYDQISDCLKCKGRPNYCNFYMSKNNDLCGWYSDILKDIYKHKLRVCRDRNGLLERIIKNEDL